MTGAKRWERLKAAFGPTASTWSQPVDAIHSTLYHPDTFYAWRKEELGPAHNDSREALPHTASELHAELETIKAVARAQPSKHLALEVGT